VDVEWYWYHYGAGDDMIVQRNVEQALMNEGYEVVEASSTDAFPSRLTIDRMLQKNKPLDIAAALKADYLVPVKAIAVHASAGQAYGVKVHGSNVEITARLIRVADGKLLEVVDENVTEGDQSQRTTARNALKAGSKKLSRQLIRKLNSHVAAAE
jgi:hypothetical protein